MNIVSSEVDLLHLRQLKPTDQLWATRPAMLEVHLLGRFALRVGGEAADALTSRPAQLLLAYLLLNPGTAHRRERLAGLLWPESLESTARKNLRNAVWQLRKVIGEEFLQAEKDTLAFRAEAPLALDVAQLSNRAALDDLDALIAAVAAYQGELLPGVYADWVQLERERLRGLFEQRVQTLLERLAAQGRWAEVQTWADHWIALGQVPEPAFRFLMRASAARGDLAGMALAYRRCLQTLQAELAVSPSAETQALYQQLSQSAPAHSAAPAQLPAAAVQPAPLPLQPTAFVGRAQELAEIAQWLGNARLLTLVGPGGAGKTRLALEAARAAAEHTQPPLFPDGVGFVPLAGLTAAEQLVPAIAQALGFSFYSSETPRAQLLDYLRPRQLLLVLDNFEHLLEAANTSLVADLLASAPRLTLLVTSRVRLNLQGEQILRVSGLAWPETAAAGEAAEASSAVQLFRQSAQRAAPEFTLTAADRPAIIRICQLVQGLPLGLVLAAAWLAVLTPDEIAREIEQNLDFLEAELSDLPERQRSLRGVFDASWRLLTAPERDALSQLAVFQGGFSREAAQRVAGAAPKTLLALVNKSWLQPEAGGRCRVHTLLRQYLLEHQAVEPAAWRQCQARHTAYFTDSLHRLSPRLRDQQLPAVFALVDAHLGDITAAWQRLVEQGQVEVAVYQMLPALYRYCEAHFQGFVLQPLLVTAQAAAREITAAADRRRALTILLTAQAAFLRTGAPARISALEAAAPAHQDALREAWSLAGSAEQLASLSCWGPMLASLYGWLIDPAEAVQELRWLLPLLRNSDEPERRWELAFALQSLGRLLHTRLPDEAPASQLAEARDHLQAALALFQELGDEREAGYTLRVLGIVHLVWQKFPEAAACLQAAQAALVAIGDWSNSAAVDWLLADIDLRRSDFDSAFQRLRRMAQRFAERGHARNAAAALSRESYLALRYSTPDHARQVRQQTLAMAQATGDTYSLAWFTWEMGEIERVTGDLAAARRWYDQARTLFEQTQDEGGGLFYQRGLGDLAFSLGDHAEARRCFQASLDGARRLAHEWGAAYALTGLSRAALAQGDHEQARLHLVEALPKAAKTGDGGILLLAMTRAAELLNASGQTAAAADLAARVVGHSSTWHETRAQAALLLPAPPSTSTPADHAGELWPEAQRLLQTLTGSASAPLAGFAPEISAPPFG